MNRSIKPNSWGKWSLRLKRRTLKHDLLPISGPVSRTWRLPQIFFFPPLGVRRGLMRPGKRNDGKGVYRGRRGPKWKSENISWLWPSSIKGVQHCLVDPPTSPTRGVSRFENGRGYYYNEEVEDWGVSDTKNSIEDISSPLPPPSLGRFRYDPVVPTVRNQTIHDITSRRPLYHFTVAQVWSLTP